MGKMTKVKDWCVDHAPEIAGGIAAGAVAALGCYLGWKFGFKAGARKGLELGIHVPPVFAMFDNGVVSKEELKSTFSYIVETDKMDDFLPEVMRDTIMAQGGDPNNIVLMAVSKVIDDATTH